MKRGIKQLRKILIFFLQKVVKLRSRWVNAIFLLITALLSRPSVLYLLCDSF